MIDVNKARAVAAAIAAFGDERLPQRFWSKCRVDEATGCWLWTGCRRSGKFDYGKCKHNGRQCTAHRVSYTVLVGDIPDGLVLDHLCMTPPCVNPAHLDPVTHRVNILRGRSVSATATRLNMCTRGHVYTDGSYRSYTYDGQTYRKCIQCRDEYDSTRRPATGVRSRKLNDEQWLRLTGALRVGRRVAELAAEYGLSRATVYAVKAALKRAEVEGGQT